MIYYHKHEVRWSDIDANRHLANSSYVQYCAQTRMAFMTKHKMGVAQLNRWGIGPVILHERYSFFKEVYADQEVIVSLEISGILEKVQTLLKKLKPKQVQDKKMASKNLKVKVDL